MSDNHSRRAFLRRSTAAVTAVTAIATPVTAETHTESEASDAPYYEIEQTIHAEVNRRREDRGLDPLAYNANVAAAARNYSREMIAGNFFSHTAPGDSSFAEHYRDDGVDCSSLGENILYRTRSAESPQGVAANVVDQWMGSAGHRDNILGDWQSEGVGVAVTEDGVVYVTQGFGSCPGTTDADGGSAGSDSGGSSDGTDGSADSGSGGSDDGSSGETDTGSDGSSGDGNGSAGSGSDGSDHDTDGGSHHDGDRDGRWHDEERDDEHRHGGERYWVEVEDHEDGERGVGDWCADWYDKHWNGRNR